MIRTSQSLVCLGAVPEGEGSSGDGSVALRLDEVGSKEDLLRDRETVETLWDRVEVAMGAGGDEQVTAGLFGTLSDVP